MVLEKHVFNITKEYKQYEGISGIYALIYNNEVIYVGQSVNIRKRLSQHHSFNSNIKEYTKRYNDTNKECCLNTVKFYQFVKDNIQDIYFIVLPVEKEKLNDIEEHYITKYQPIYNWAGVKIPYPHPEVA